MMLKLGTKLRKVIVAVMVLSIIMSISPVMPAAAKQVPGGLLEGLKISVMGDSISTYHGWSDAYPITDPSCTNRYGEAYYGPGGGDFHVPGEISVEDTWWHQAATQLGGEILMSNAGNSTGLFVASYPANADWDLYLKEMLAWKSRPYYLGKDGVDPDIIALYIGSNEAARAKVAQMGSIDDVDFDALITANADGTYTYAEPATVAESYCILLHKIAVTYPDAEVYCFAVVPSAGGTVNTVNKRMAQCIAFNDMVRGVAAHHGAILVDLFEEFDLDPNGDGVLEEADFKRFSRCYHNDPHPNARGFDVITDAFVKAVQEHSRYGVSVQTKADLMESIDTTAIKASDGPTVIERSANLTTESGMKVTYSGTATFSGESCDPVSSFEDEYTSKKDGYTAKGGSELSSEAGVPALTVEIPMADENDPATDKDETTNTVYGAAAGVISREGDIKSGDDDGIYDYSETGILRRARLSASTSSIVFDESVGSYQHNMDFTRATVQATGTNNLVAHELEKGYEGFTVRDGFDAVYLGSEIVSRFWVAHIYTSPHPNNPTEVPYYPMDGFPAYVIDPHAAFISRKLVVPKMYLLDGTVLEGGPWPARFDSVQMYTFRDKSGTVFNTYCADQFNGPAANANYKIMNLEDSDYYSPEQGRMLRTVVNNGYWGTESGFGSFEAFKARLAASGQFTEAELAAIDEGKALTATQYSVWHFSNVMSNSMRISVYGTNASATKVGTVAADEDVALIIKMYHYLVSLAPTLPEQIGMRSTTADTIINEKNFVNGATLTITDKPLNHPNNLDYDDTNDAYIADIAVALSVIPAEENDDNLVIALSGVGNEPILGRIAGELQPGEVQLGVNDLGMYVFEDVTVTEGDYEMSITMTGYQNLSRCPHLLYGELVEDDGEWAPSQHMVAVGSGKRAVGVDMAVGFSFDADDPFSYSSRVWRTEEKPTPAPNRPNPKTGISF